MDAGDKDTDGVNDGVISEAKLMPEKTGGSPFTHPCQDPPRADSLMPPVNEFEGTREVIEERRVHVAELMVEAGMVAVPEAWSL